MPTHLLQALEQERRRRFAGLAGTRVDALLPVRQALVDAQLARVPRWPAPLERLGVRIAPSNRIHVAATIRVFGFRTRLSLSLRLAPAVEDGRVRLFLDDRSLVASAISWLGPLAGRLPDGVTLQGNQIVADLAKMAADRGLGDLAALLSSASFESDEGVLWINARLAVPEGVPDAGGTDRQRAAGGEAGEPRAPTDTAPADVSHRPAHPPSLPVSLDELVAWLGGLRVDADVRVGEPLANELLAAAHADARTKAASDANPASTLARALRRPVVRFEDGALRLTAGADLADQAEAAVGDPRNA